MSEAVRFAVDSATAAQIEAHLRENDSRFEPALSSRVELAAYARKIAERSTTFEAWAASRLVGLVAIYTNAGVGGVAHVTSVSVSVDHAGEGLAAELLSRGIDHVSRVPMARISLEVGAANDAARGLYEKFGFAEDHLDRAHDHISMTRDVHNEENT